MSLSIRQVLLCQGGECICWCVYISRRNNANIKINLWINVCVCVFMQSSHRMTSHEFPDLDQKYIPINNQCLNGSYGVMGWMTCFVVSCHYVMMRSWRHHISLSCVSGDVCLHRIIKNNLKLIKEVIIPRGHSLRVWLWISSSLVSRNWFIMSSWCPLRQPQVVIL